MFTNITSDTDYKATYVLDKPLFYGRYVSEKSISGGTTSKIFTPLEDVAVLKLLACPSEKYEKPSKMGLQLIFSYGEYPNNKYVNINELEITNGNDIFSLHMNPNGYESTDVVLCANKIGDNMPCSIRHIASGETIDIICNTRMPKIRLATRNDSSYDYRPLIYDKWSRMTTVLCETIDYIAGSQNEPLSPEYVPFIDLSLDASTELSHVPIELTLVDDNAKIQTKLDYYIEGKRGGVDVYAKSTVDGALSNMQIYYTIFGKRVDLGVFKCYKL